MAQAIQTLSQDALVILQQAVSLAKDEQIAGIDSLRAVEENLSAPRSSGRNRVGSMGERCGGNCEVEIRHDLPPLF